jgi:hypothetical protein
MGVDIQVGVGIPRRQSAVQVKQTHLSGGLVPQGCPSIFVWAMLQH